MAKTTAIHEVDRRVATLVRRSPGLGVSAAMTMVFQADARLYRRFRREMAELGAVLGGTPSGHGDEGERLRLKDRS